MKLAVIFVLALIATSVQAKQNALPDTSQRPTPAAQAAAQAHDAGPPEAIIQLKKFAAAYNLAMAKKETPALLNFYYDGTIPVVGSVSRQSFTRMTEASHGKAPKIYFSNAKDQSTADTSANATAEKVSNLRVRTDGTVASIDYDYAIPQGYGHTFWTLVDTKNGLKITSIVYSINIRSALK